MCGWLFPHASRFLEREWAVSLTLWRGVRERAEASELWAPVRVDQVWSRRSPANRARAASTVSGGEKGMPRGMLASILLRMGILSTYFIHLWELNKTVSIKAFPQCPAHGRYSVFIDYELIAELMDPMASLPLGGRWQRCKIMFVRFIHGVSSNSSSILWVNHNFPFNCWRIFELFPVLAIIENAVMNLSLEATGNIRGVKNWKRDMKRVESWTAEVENSHSVDKTPYPWEN